MNKLPLVLSSLVLAVASTASAAVVLSETFATDGVFNNPSVQTGVGTWNSNLSVVGGALQIVPNGFLNIDVAAQAAPLIELKFDLINANANDGIVMLSLGGTRQTSPSFSDGKPGKQNFWIKTILVERPGPWDTFNGYPNISSTTASFTFTFDTVAKTTLLNVNGVNYGTKSTADWTAFDGSSALSFAFGGDAGVTGKIDNISLSTVPEPATYGFIFGLMVVAVALWRKRVA
ncbi:MAG: hypothetical protein SFY80_05375 [Verrucomicrobiota bacterium]|nr:hypothetical protein [Verrucomicrobiota bacterium]